MIRFPILVILFAARAFAADLFPFGCETACGLQAPLETDCARLQHYEDRVLREFSVRVAKWDTARMCSALDGYKLFVAGSDERGLFTIPWGPDGTGSTGGARRAGTPTRRTGDGPRSESAARSTN